MSKEAMKLAQPEQKYRRGDRLVCLETDEYCVIHIAGTNRQWVKFPDTHIGVYTNEQVDQLFEKLAREIDLTQPEHSADCALLKIPSKDCDCQPEQEPVAWVQMAFARLNMMRDKMHRDDVTTVQRFLDGEYPAPSRRKWQGLTADEIWGAWFEQARPERDTRNFVAAFARAIEARLKEKNHG